MKNVNLKQLARLLRERPEIPDGKCGRVSVTHRVVPVNENVVVVSMRNALLMGVKPVSTRFDPPLVIRTLQEEGRGDPRIQAYLRMYLTPGTDFWEREFGDLWDEYVTEKEKEAV